MAAEGEHGDRDAASDAAMTETVTAPPKVACEPREAADGGLTD